MHLALLTALETGELAKRKKRRPKHQPVPSSRAQTSWRTHSLPACPPTLRPVLIIVVVIGGVVIVPARGIAELQRRRPRALSSPFCGFRLLPFPLGSLGPPAAAPTPGRSCRQCVARTRSPGGPKQRKIFRTKKTRVIDSLGENAYHRKMQQCTHTRECGLYRFDRCC